MGEKMKKSNKKEGTEFMNIHQIHPVSIKKIGGLLDVFITFCTAKLCDKNLIHRFSREVECELCRERISD